ncbi:MAG: transglutaminase domain-containing protein, partial [Anaerolineae bacterium]
ATLPAGLAVFIVQFNDPTPLSRIWFLAVYLILALTLAGRLHHLRRQEAWRASGILLPPEAGADITGGALTVAAILVFAAWLLPPAISKLPPAAEAWSDLTRAWRKANDRLSDLFAAARNPRQVIGKEFYGDQLPLGTAIPLGDAVIFTVHVNPTQISPPRYYWRTRVYDHYENGRWSTTAGMEIGFQPEQERLAVPVLPSQAVADLAFTYAQEQIALYTASQPLWFSRPASLRAFPLPDGTTDVVTLHARKPIGPGETYRSQVALASPTIVELRAAGTDYPDWVRERYLQLPENFSPRIRELAQAIAGDLPTPYDQAAAITDYLRSDIRYSEHIPTPPPDVDPLEWVLFDLKQGFCNYYASAEVLMLRSLGVPARLAVGFAEGEYDIQESTYIVRQRDSHAWPEVYFPGIGWVEFEPTAGQRPLVRPRGGISPEEEEKRALRQDVPSLIETPTEERPAEISQPSPPSILLWGLIGLLSAGVLLASWYTNRRYAWANHLPVRLQSTLERHGIEPPIWLQRWSRHAEQTPITRAFQTINWGLRLLGESPPPHATPARRAAMLAALLPEADEAIHILLEEHQRDLYSPRPGDERRAQRAAYHLRKSIILARVAKFWGTLKE